MSVLSEDAVKLGKDARLIMPKRPNWHRYRQIISRKEGLTLWRALGYEALREIEFRGRVLDFGGGEKAHYLPILRDIIKNGSYESVNISSDMLPTYLVRPEEHLPLPSDSFDMVLAINTLEHVFGIHETLSQLIRVLKPGGMAVFITPFLYRVHGSPCDYNRPTAQWWAVELERHNLTDINIEPLMWDAFSAGVGLSEGVGPAPLRKLLGLVIPLYGLFYAWLRARPASPRFSSDIGVNLANYALGYLVTARKRQPCKGIR